MATISLTRRGRAAVGVVVFALAMSVAAGGRALDAVVLSGGVALLAGYVQLRTIDPPRFERTLPGADHAGRTGIVELDSRGAHAGRHATSAPRGFVATVADRLGAGVSAPDASTRTTVGEEPVRYRLRYDARGEHPVGPTDVTATDVFGLFTRQLTVGSAESVVVYPTRHPVTGWVDAGHRGEGILETDGREEFDRLREYAGGDSLRDVHWAATAKHGGLVVREYAAETGRDRVRLVGGTAPDAGPAAADALAEAAVSLALPISEAGVSVECLLPNGRVEAAPTPAGRRRLRELTAGTVAGAPPETDETTVRLLADGDGVTVETPGGTTTFAALRVDDSNDSGGSNDSDDAVGRGGGTVDPSERESAGTESSPAATDGGVFE